MYLNTCANVHILCTVPNIRICIYLIRYIRIFIPVSVFLSVFVEWTNMPKYTEFMNYHIYDTSSWLNVHLKITSLINIFIWIKYIYFDYQPMIIRLFSSNSNIVNPLVNTSTLCSLALILLISISLGWILERNQW